MIVFTTFRKGSLDYVRRGSNVVLRKKTTKTESFSKRMTFATKCDQSSPPRARGLHGLGKLITKSAPCAVRTVRRNGGHTTSAITTPQRSCREQLLQGGARKRRYRCKCAQILAASRRLRETLKSRSQRHLRYCMLRSYITGQDSHIENTTIQMHHVEGYTDLEWPVDASNRRNALCACFSHAQTRPDITPYTPKK